MFADGIRLAGLELLAQNRIADGLPLCIDLIAPDRWGMGNRIEPCLQALRQYGGAARDQLDRLRALQADLEQRNWDPKRREKLDIPGLIVEIEAAEVPDLRSLPAPVS
ncbi:MAG: hypothetical protein ACYSUU_10365 [Planctomycetota bacterium]|jgi:hypothetical protein